MLAITTLKAVLYAGAFVLGRWRPPFRPAHALLVAAILIGAAGPAVAEPVAEARDETVAAEPEQARPEESSTTANEGPTARAKVASVHDAEAPPPAGRSIASSIALGYAQIVTALDREAMRHGLPPEIAEAVTHTESRFNQAAIGGDGEIGLMQVLPSTARMMGFSGSLAQLAVPETNIRYGVTYLAQAWRLARGDLCTAVMKYRAGHGETRFSHLSVDYCLKVRSRLSSRGFAVTGSVPVATFGNPAGSPRIGGGGRCRGTCLAGSAGGADINALNNRLNQLIVKVTVLKVPMR